MQRGKMIEAVVVYGIAAMDAVLLSLHPEVYEMGLNMLRHKHLSQ
jgi:hypothetical protein